MNGKDKGEKKCGISVAARCLPCSQTDTQVVVTRAITATKGRDGPLLYIVWLSLRA